jgi:gamma-glutamyltranspeptidase/glutathione hydrolase
MGIQEAGDAPRFRHIGSSQPTGEKMLDGGRLALESGIGREVIRGLIEKGHSIVKDSGGFGGYQGIWWDHKNNILIGGSELRKDGCAMGY